MKKDSEQLVAEGILHILAVVIIIAAFFKAIHDGHI